MPDPQINWVHDNPPPGSFVVTMTSSEMLPARTDPLKFRKGLTITNLGTQTIWCALGDVPAVVGVGIPIVMNEKVNYDAGLVFTTSINVIVANATGLAAFQEMI